MPTQATRAADEQAHLDAQVQVVAERGDDDERDHGDQPAQRHPRVAAERDHGLRHRLGEHEQHAARGEQADRAVAEVEVRRRTAAGSPTGRSRTRRATATAPTPATTATSLRKPMRNSSNLPALASADSFGSSAACTAWNRNSGMRAMITAVKNCDDQLVLALAGEDLHRDRPAVDEHHREHRSGQQRTERARQLRPRRVGAVGHDAVLAAQRDRARRAPA